LTNLRLAPLLDYHRRCRALVTVALYQVANPWECGLVALDGEGRVRRFVEKPPRDQVFTDLANAGVYVCEPALLDYIPPDQPCDFGRDVFPLLLARGLPVFGFPISDYLLDIGTPEKYAQAQRDLEGGKLGPPATIGPQPPVHACQTQIPT
jgi:NDP-sugar pyrophosphorylase family protein